MIEWIIGFLVAKWWVDKEEKKQKEMEQVQFSGNIDYSGIPYGYVRDGESVKDLT
jgi:hypothetical protein